MSSSAHAISDCFDRLHVYDTREATDNHYDPNRADYFRCQAQPCPNRHSGPVSVHVDPWGSPVLPEQADRIRRKHPKGYFEENHSEEEIEGELFPSRSTTPIPGPPIPPTAPLSLPPNPSILPTTMATPGDPTAAPTIAVPSISVSDVNKAFDKVPKLSSDGNNYLLWLKRVNFAVMSLEHDDLLTAPPTADTTSHAKKILVGMLGKMENSIFMLSQGQTTPYALVTFLNSRFDSKSDTLVALAKRRMYQMRCHNESDLIKHLDSLEKHVTRLGDLGYTLPDTDYIDIIITSVPESYQTLIETERRDTKTRNDLAHSLNIPGYTDKVLTSAMVLALLREKALTRSKPVKPRGDSASSASTSGKLTGIRR